MFCTNCGNKASIKDKFCNTCGSQLRVIDDFQELSNDNKLHTSKYEKKKFVWHFPKDVEPQVQTVIITLDEMRKRFWEDYKEEIESEISKWIDEGWEPIEDVNSSRIKLEKVEKTQRLPIGCAEIFLIIITFGLYLLIHLLNPPITIQYRKPTEYSLTMRRAIK